MHSPDRYIGKAFKDAQSQIIREAGYRIEEENIKKAKEEMSKVKEIENVYRYVCDIAYRLNTGKDVSKEYIFPNLLNRLSPSLIIDGLDNVSRAPDKIFYCIKKSPYIIPADQSLLESLLRKSDVVVPGHKEIKEVANVQE